MPWKPSYTEEEAAGAMEVSLTWTEALRRLGLNGHGKNIATLRRWADKWGIATDHLEPYRPRMKPRFTESEARRAIEDSFSWSAALRRLGYCPTGGNPRTLRKWASEWGIPTDHFDPYKVRANSRRAPISMEKVLVERSSYSRGTLKRRLFDEGFKERRCELCGQDEVWKGRPMSLILDHMNGVRDDNRLENLQVVCPNCAATLETHCGRSARIAREPRCCLRCGKEFQPSNCDHRYCSRRCGTRWDRRGNVRPGARRVERPPYEQLLREIEETSYVAVGRKYGVSDNAIRKWVRWYENEAALEPAQLKLGTTDESAASDEQAT